MYMSITDPTRAKQCTTKSLSQNIKRSVKRIWIPGLWYNHREQEILEVSLMLTGRPQACYLHGGNLRHALSQSSLQPWTQLCWHHSAPGVRDRGPISELPCSLVMADSFLWATGAQAWLKGNTQAVWQLDWHAACSFVLVYQSCSYKS